MKTLKSLSCAASVLFLLSSCNTMSSIASQIFEPTESVYATVEHASAPKYYAESSIGKGKGKITSEAHYEQNYNIRTDDGRRLRGSQTYGIYDTGKQLYTGARGQATIGLKTGRLKDFEVSY